ncbi:hypothetical protein L9F63_007182 [Diploptera punctata]|uniref:Dihydrolipoyllysine-residue succinyltransferase component of 2-oxoglutarate dehydrogenase complex, mitochondrial n=1 Tax=Diploptera punctata TaxID=6984 RepID=A0AAD7Z8X8_DIPPU|nr:hypothetical protein L9F63_007182 [Diploptera punctata]
MSGMLTLTSRNLPQNVLRLTLKVLEPKNVQRKSKSYSSYSYDITGTKGQVYNVRNGQRLKTHQQWNPIFREFRTSIALCDDVKIVNVPPFAESVSEGDVRWEKAVGDSVSEDEVVLEIETDKTSVPVPSPASGIIEERYVEDGATVKAGQKLFKLKVTGRGPSTNANLCKRKTQSLAKPGVAAIRHAQAIEAATVKLPPADPTSEITGTRSEQRVKMNRMRQRIAQRLKEAQNVNAMLTTFNEVDMTNIMEFRKTHQEAFLKKHGIKFGFMSAFVKASAYALQDQPVVNAVIDGSEIVYRDYVDISVAVATPKTLITELLLRQAIDLRTLGLAINALGEKAKKNALAVEDMDGGTFTISNGGVFGSLMGTPIINPPQSAILGMHGIFERPIALKGQVVIRPMMYIALTYDHRLIDGREAVFFLRKIKSAVEDPRTMLIGI